MSSRYRLLAMGGLVLSAGLTACSGDGVSPPQRYTVGGAVTGLEGGSVVLRNNGSDDLAIASDGGFHFPTPLPSGSSYSISVASQPAGQTCQVSNGAGTVGPDVNNVLVECQASSYSIGGTVSGLVGGELILSNNGEDEVSVTANGGFTFETGLVSGSTFQVEVAAQPAGQMCTVSGGTGLVGDADITTVSVNCGAVFYSVGGTISGLAGGTAILQNNGGDDLSLTADGSFAFAAALPNGSGYDVSVIVQPVGRLCTIERGNGTVDGADVSDVMITCSDAFAVGGTVTGLGGNAVLLQNNGGDDLSVSQNGEFTFATLVTNGAGYEVSVAVQPAGQVCVVGNGSGTVAGADVTDVEVTCTAEPLSNRIAFHSDRDGDFEIFVMDPDGSNVAQLTNNEVDDFWPAISPDGTKIAFWTGRDGNQEIYVMDADGSNPGRVTTNGAADRQPAWSPDGQRLAFQRVVSGTAEIFTIKSDGTGENRLTFNAIDDTEPAWSPNGALIAFTTNRDGNNEVYVMSASDGSNPINLTNNPGRDGKPDWSPNGSRLLFDRNNSSVDSGWLGDAEVMCMSADGSGQVRLTTDTAGFVDTQPRWSANGSRLVFNSDRVVIGDPELYVGSTNNCTGITQDIRVTFSSGKDAAGDWSP